MEATPIKRGVTLQEYLAFERDAPVKHFLRDGEIFEVWAMAGATPTHNTLATNALGLLFGALRGGPCRPFNSDQKIWIPRKRGVVYPDVSVVCERLSLREETTDVVTNPSLVLAVLSPGTEAFDRADKFAGYRSVETLRHYVRVSSQEVNGGALHPRGRRILDAARARPWRHDHPLDAQPPHRRRRSLRAGLRRRRGAVVRDSADLGALRHNRDSGTTPRG